MGNIHLGKEITVINLQEIVGAPYAGMQAIADDLKQNLTGLSDTVCNVEGTLLSGLMNDIGIADEEVKQFNVTLTEANEDFKKFLAKIDEFKLHPLEVTFPPTNIYNNTIDTKVETTLDKVDKWFDIFDHATGIISNVVGTVGGIKSFLGTGKVADEGGEGMKNIYEGMKGIKDDATGLVDDLSADAAETGVDALAAESTEALIAAGLVEEGAELGALLGPEGIVAGAIIGLVAYGIGQAISSHESDYAENKPISLDEQMTQLWEKIQNEAHYGEDTTQDINRYHELQKEEDKEEAKKQQEDYFKAISPDNDYVRTYSKKQNAEYDKYLAKEAAGTAYLPGGYGGGLTEYQYFQDKEKEKKQAHALKSSAIHGGFSSLGDISVNTLHAHSLYADSLHSGASASHVQMDPYGSGSSLAGSGLSSSSFFPVSSSSPSGGGGSASISINAVPSASSVGGAKAMGGGVGGAKGGASVHNISHLPSYTINNHSATSANNIHEQVVAILTSAVADAKIGTDIH